MSNVSDFEIRDGVLVHYNGGDVYKDTVLNAFPLKANRIKYIDVE